MGKNTFNIRRGGRIEKANNPVTSQEHKTHTRKRSRVSGCASKIASDTKTSLVPKEGGGGGVGGGAN